MSLRFGVLPRLTAAFMIGLFAGSGVPGLASDRAYAGTSAADMASRSGKASPVVNVNISGLRLSEALHYIGGAGEVTIVFGDQITSFRGKIDLAGQMSVGEALQRVLTPLGLEAILVGEGIYRVSQRTPPPEVGQISDPQPLPALPRIEEIVVSTLAPARHFMDVPAGVTVLDRQELKANMITTTREALSLVPNSLISPRSRRIDNNFSIRGISSAMAIDRSIAFLYNNANIARSSVNPVLHDIERIEVTRGAQSEAYGRSAVGGTISVHTARPHHGFEVSAAAEYSRFDTWQLDGVVNVPLAGSLGARFAAYHEESDGFIRNIDPIGGGSDYRVSSFRFSVGGQIDPLTSAYLTVSHGDDHEGLPVAVPSGVISDFGALIRELEGLDPLPAPENNIPDELKEVSVNTLGSSDISTTIADLALERRFSGVTASLTLALVRQELDASVDGDGSSLPISRAYRFQEFGSDFAELRLASAPGRLEWVVGATLSFERFKDFFFTEFGLPPSVPPLEIDQPLIQPLPEFQDSGEDAATWWPADYDYVERRIDSYAAYGEVVWRLSDTVAVQAGSRYIFERLSIDGFDPFGVMTRSQSGSYDYFLPYVGISYSALDVASFYVSAARGFKSGGFNSSDIFARSVLDEYEPEIGWSFEIGAKFSVPEWRLRASITLFYMLWQDGQVAISVSPGSGFRNFVSNLFDAEHKGIEVEAAFEPLPGLNFSGSVGYLDADITRSSLINPTLLGDRVPLAPKWTARINSEYRHSLSQEWEAFGRAEWDYRSAMTFAFPASSPSMEAFDSPGRDVWNFRRGLARGSWSVVAYIENAFNEKYFDGVSFENSILGVYIQPEPRRFGIRVGVDL